MTTFAPIDVKEAAQLLERFRRDYGPVVVDKDYNGFLYSIERFSSAGYGAETVMKTRSLDQFVGKLMDMSIANGVIMIGVWGSIDCRGLYGIAVRVVDGDLWSVWNRSQLAETNIDADMMDVFIKFDESIRQEIEVENANRV